MIELDVRGMDCQHCAQTVRDAVLKLDPAADVSVDLDAGRVRAETTATGAALEAAIAAAGYPATAHPG